ncbi:ABC transporter G family member 5 isoform X5 [Manihot esculenta]|uniref:ABC transporter G family member 5 isoform X5 n=1 Tax=Manihot esculenta TaxID=3983 RepID=UPI000B5D5929|nr:ABC transporter G family member 5 isoform X5 [Manihot esculenta]
MESPKDRSKCNPSEESSIAVSFQLDPLVSSNGNNNPSENNPQEQQRKPNTNNENNKSSKALAKGSSLMLASIIKDFDSKAQDTLKSQDHLNCIIDRHTREKGRAELMEAHTCYKQNIKQWSQLFVFFFSFFN